MLPAHERFDADQLIRSKVDLGLEMQDKLVFVDRPLQLANQRQAVAGVAVLFGMVDGKAAAAALGDIHRDICSAHERIRVVAVLGREGDADAHAHDHWLIFYGVWRLEPAQQVVQHGHHAVSIGIWQDYGELVAPQAGDGVCLAQRAPQAGADLLEQQVAGIVAESVIDFLEAIEVHQHEAQRGAVALGGSNR